MSTMSGEAEEKPPWRQPDVLHELWHEKELTNVEIGEKLGCSGSTVSHWLRRLEVKEGKPDVELPDNLSESPWQDEELMEWLYHDEGLSAGEIAMVLDCSTGSVFTWLDRHDFKKRSQKEAAKHSLGKDHMTFLTTSKGYEAWWVPSDVVYVHRLVAVAENGLDAVVGNHVHHRNGIRWDNRPGNLEVKTPSDHHSDHNRKVEGEDRREIAKMYDETDLSSYQIAEKVEHDISPSTVLKIWREYYDES